MGLIKPAFAAFTALGLAAMPALPANAQDDHAALLQQISDSLPGDMINDPTTLDYDVQGGNLRTRDIIDPQIPGGGAATQYEVRRAGDNPWDIQAYIPLTSDIADGDVITVGFWARTEESEGDGGLGQVTARVQQNSSPWPGFGDTTFSVGSGWRWYEMSTRADINVRQRDAFVVLQLAALEQTVEIGQALVVKGADQIMGNGARPAPPLPSQLEGRGTLISLADNRDWSLQGPDGTIEARADETIWLGRAVQFASPSAGDQPWAIQASVPLSEAVAAGDRLEIAIAAKTVSASTEDGNARVGIRVQQTGEPFEGFGDNTFAVGPNWQLVRIRTTATMDLEPGSSVVALHFAGAEQVVDIGPAYVVKLNEE